MEWRVKLDGDVSNLGELSKSLNSPELAIVKEDDSFYLKSDQLAKLDNYREIQEKAEGILTSLNGAARLALGASSPITIASIATVNNDGTQKVFVEASVTLSTSASVSLLVKRVDGTTQEVNPADSIPGWMAVARNNESAARVLRLLHAGPLDWVDLYRILEIIEDDVGGTIYITQKGWASDRLLRRFKHTANSPSTIGDEARHGKEQTEPPAKPMSFSEANGLIKTILRNWLNSKQMQDNTNPTESA